MEIREVTPGPYRATKLWNEVTKYFRAEMPRRKHRQHFKKYQNCFTAAEAIDWLHQLLRNNSNFGPEVTRKQTIQLLRKFLKNHVIEDIKGRWGSENLDDNHHLYRILPRQHLLSENTDNTTKQTESIFKLPHYSRRTPQKYAFRECQENIENIKSAALEEKPHSERVAVEALQICCLLIPPPNRRKLQLLMRMISRMSENVDMPRLHDEMGTKSLSWGKT
ncbi:DEP domain-containing protein 1A [Varanus komodoensis]|nr:DEP domain-containing protein 1A [Varanus komodoensis]